MRILGIMIVAICAFLIYVRLAPSDPERWHRLDHNLTGDETLAGGAVRRVALGEGGLERLDRVIRGTDHTRLLAGSVEDGIITYVTRTPVIGFPDYTTVRQTADHTEIYGRLRYGLSDLGVNAARIDGWLAQLVE